MIGPWLERREAEMRRQKEAMKQQNAEARRRAAESDLATLRALCAKSEASLSESELEGAIANATRSGSGGSEVVAGAAARLRAMRARRAAALELSEALAAAEGEPSGAGAGAGGPAGAARALSDALRRAEGRGAADAPVVQRVLARLAGLQTAVRLLSSASNPVLCRISCDSIQLPNYIATQADALASSEAALLAIELAAPGSASSGSVDSSVLTEAVKSAEAAARTLASTGFAALVKAAAAAGDLSHLREAVRALEGLGASASSDRRTASARQAQLRDARGELERSLEALRGRVRAALREGPEAGEAAVEEALAEATASAREELEAVIPAAADAGGPPRALAVFRSADAARAAAALLPASVPCMAVALGELAPVRAHPKTEQQLLLQQQPNSKAGRKAKGRAARAHVQSLGAFLASSNPEPDRNYKLEEGAGGRGAGLAELEAPEILVEASEASPPAAAARSATLYQPPALQQAQPSSNSKPPPYANPRLGAVDAASGRGRPSAFRPWSPAAAAAIAKASSVIPAVPIGDTSADADNGLLDPPAPPGHEAGPGPTHAPAAAEGGAEAEEAETTEADLEEAALLEALLR
eukprot:tig00000189_g14351.t1